MTPKAEFSLTPAGSEQVTSNTETIFDFCPIEFLG